MGRSIHFLVALLLISGQQTDGSSWASWSEWSDCTQVSSQTIQTRIRICQSFESSPPVDCPGNNTQSQICGSQPRPASFCPIGFEHSYNGVCYAVRKEPLNGYQAHASCSQMNGVLAIIDSSEVSNLLMGWDSVNKWFGLIRKSATDVRLMNEWPISETLISQMKGDEASWSAEVSSNPECGYLDGQGKWGAKDCSEEMSGYICEFKGMVCPPGYRPVGTECIAIKPNLLNERLHINCHGYESREGQHLWTLPNDPFVLGVMAEILRLHWTGSNNIVFTNNDISSTIGFGGFSIDPSGPGSYLAIHNVSDQLVMRPYESIPDASSLCVADDSNYQCDFDHPYWYETRCSWRYMTDKQREAGLPESTSTFETVRSGPLDTPWLKVNNITDNYYIQAKGQGFRALTSKAVKLNHHSKIFSPFFGFYYRGNQAEIGVKYLEETNSMSGQPQTIDILPIRTTDFGSSWQYFIFNFTKLASFQNLSGADQSPSRYLTFRLIVYTNVKAGGFLDIDNMGPCSIEEFYFPAMDGSPNRIGSCFWQQENANRFLDIPDACNSMSRSGLQQASFSVHDQEYHLLLPGINNLNWLSSGPNLWAGGYDPYGGRRFNTFVDGTPLTKESFTKSHYPFQSSPSRFSDLHYIAYSYNNNQCPVNFNHRNHEVSVAANNQATNNPQPVVCQGGPCSVGLVPIQDHCVGVGSPVSNWEEGSKVCPNFKGADNLPGEWYCEESKRSQLKKVFQALDLVDKSDLYYASKAFGSLLRSHKYYDGSTDCFDECESSSACISPLSPEEYKSCSYINSTLHTVFEECNVGGSTLCHKPYGSDHDSYNGYENWLKYPLQFFPEADLLAYNDAEKYCHSHGGRIPNWFHDDHPGYQAAYEQGMFDLIKAKATERRKSRLAPNLEYFAINGAFTQKTGVASANRRYANLQHCDSKIGFLCQRKAAAGLASQANIHVGCHPTVIEADGSLLASMVSPHMTINFCVEFCMGQSVSGAAPLIGLQGQRCACLKTALGAKFSSGMCDLRCPGNPSQVCGGRGTFSVFNLLNRTAVEEAVFVFNGFEGEPRAEIILPGGRVESLAEFPPLPEPLKYGSVTMDGRSKLIHCGGATAGQVFHEGCFSLDFSADILTWSSMDSIPQTKKPLAFANNEGHLIACTISDKSCWHFDEMWKPLKDLPSPLTSITPNCIFVENNTLIAFGMAGHQIYFYDFLDNREWFSLHLPVEVHQGFANPVANFKGRKGFLFALPSPFKMYFIHLENLQVVSTSLVQELPQINLMGSISFLSLADEIHLINSDTTNKIYSMDWMTETMQLSDLGDKLQCSPDCSVVKATTKWWPDIHAPSVFGRRYTSCREALALGAVQPNDGQPMKLLLEDGTFVNCSKENIDGGSLSCPKGWYGNADNGFCFQVHLDMVSNIEASRQCLSMGANLVAPKTPADEDMVTDVLTSRYDYAHPISPGFYHLGIYQNQQKNIIYQSNGKTPTFIKDKPWSGPLAQTTISSCLAYNTIIWPHVMFDYRYKWLDISCERPARFICMNNPDFLGFRPLAAIDTESVVQSFDIETNSLGSCFALCSGVPDSRIIAAKGSTCKCIKDNAQVRNPTFKVQNVMTSQFLAFDDASPIAINLNDVGSDWKWLGNALVPKESDHLAIELSIESMQASLSPRDPSNPRQKFLFTSEELVMPDLAKYLSIKNNKLIAGATNEGASKWTFVPSEEETISLKKRTIEDAVEPGSYPFACDQLIPCPGALYQSCGCKINPLGSDLAILYHTGIAGDEPASASLQFTSCEDVRNKGLMGNAFYLINGQRTYCENWNADCGKGFVLLGQRCYNVSFSTIDKANIDGECATMNASPLRIDSSEILQYIKDLLEFQGEKQDIWSDLSWNSTQNGYFSSSGTSVSDLGPWVGTPPSLPNDDCVVLSISDQSKFKQTNCEKKAKYICEREACPPGFIYFDSKSCVAFIKEKATKAEARTQCSKISPNSGLPRLTRPDQEEKVKDILKSFGGGEVFLGLERDAKGHWTWDIDGSPVFVTLLNATGEVTAQFSWPHRAGQYLPSNLVDGRVLHSGSRALTTLALLQWFCLTLPEEITIKRIRVAMYPSSARNRFNNIEARVGHEEPSTLTSSIAIKLTQNTYCASFTGRPTDEKVIEMTCPKPGLSGKVVTLQSSDTIYLQALEVDVMDCPNTFVHLNNKCYSLVRPSTTYSAAADECSVKASVVFTPTTKTERFVASNLMEMYQVDVIFAGVKRAFEGDILRAESGLDISGVIYDPNLSQSKKDTAFLGLYERGRDFFNLTLDKYAQYNVICEYYKEITYTNWGVSNEYLEPLNEPTQSCAKICQGANCTKGEQWTTTSCEEELPFLCKWEFKCPQGWMAFDDACYKLERSLAMREAPEAAHEYCANIYGASGLVVNSIPEATFLRSFLTEINNFPAYQGQNIANGVLGISFEPHSRYPRFMDGSFMSQMDTFPDLRRTSLNSLVNSMSGTSCLRISEGGLVSGCYNSIEANILCEKSLAFDKRLCVNASNLGNALEVAPGVKIEVDNHLVASTCILFCRGLDFNHTLVSNNSCQCVSKLKFSPTEGDPNNFLPISQCPYGEANQIVGDGVKSLAFYSSGIESLHPAEKIGPVTCGDLHESLNLLVPGMSSTYLQNDYGTVPVKVNCDRNMDRWCLFNQIPFLPSGFLRISGAEDHLNTIDSIQNLFQYKDESYSFKACSKLKPHSEGFHNIPKVTDLCDLTQGSSLIIDGSGKLAPEVIITLKFPKPMVLTSFYVMSEYEDFYRARIKSFGAITFVPDGVVGSSDKIGINMSSTEFVYDANAIQHPREKEFFKVSNSTRPFPVVTNEVQFHNLTISSTKTNSNMIEAELVREISFQMMVFGCPLNDYNKAFCPNESTSPSGGNCTFVKRNPESGIAFEEAKIKCSEMNAEILTPSNLQSIVDLMIILSAYPGEEFWVGIEYGWSEFSGSHAWHFVNGLTIFESHLAHWANGHNDENGECVKLLLMNGEVMWKKTACSDASGGNYLCSTSQDNYRIGCYLLSPDDSAQVPTPIPADSNKAQIQEFCSLLCESQSKFYFVIREQKCLCIFSPDGGVLPDESCSKEDCKDGQDQKRDNCEPKSNYQRGVLYRTWDLGCGPLNLTGTNAYIWRENARHLWGSETTVRCHPGFELDPSLETSSKVDPNLHTQTCQCDLNDKGGSWSCSIVPCVPRVCQGNPIAPSGTTTTYFKRPDPESEHHVFTTKNVFCPANSTLPKLIQDAHGYAVDGSLGLVKNITLSCDIDGKWIVSGTPSGSICPDENPVESVYSCENPVIPECVDKTVYCPKPPEIPKDAEREDIIRPVNVTEYDHVSGTKLIFKCPKPKWAFNYSLPTPFISYAYSTNIDNISIECTESGSWKVLGGMRDETCQEPKQDGTCGEIYFPPCVDRAVRCSSIELPENALKTMVLEVDTMDHSLMGTKFKISCSLENYYFDYSIPSGTLSYFYSTNINETTFECHQDRYWIVTNGIAEETCDDPKLTDGLLTCANVKVPNCVDRTIRCPTPPMPISPQKTFHRVIKPDQFDLVNTTIQYECPNQRNVFFDYPTGPNFISYVNEPQIRNITITCNKESFWVVEGGISNVTCHENSNPDPTAELWCKEDLLIPECEDRGVYCHKRELTLEHGEVTVLKNPRPDFGTINDTSCTWKRWLNVDTDQTDGKEEESLVKLTQEFGTDACSNPIAFQARSIQTKTSSNFTGDRFEHIDTDSGLLCLNVRQPDGKCEDYEVRLCCPIQPESGTLIRYSCPTSEYYLDFKDDQFPKFLHVECQDDGLWHSEDVQSKELCSNGTKACALPNIPSCQSRKVECPLGLLPFRSDAERNLLSLGNDLYLGARYSYQCKTSGWVFNTTGYPKHIETTCTLPKNYPSVFTWYYEQWLDGIWKGTSELKECIDPNLCHEEVPELPFDLTVRSDVPDNLNRSIGSTYNYSCSEKYWVFEINPIQSCSQVGFCDDRAHDWVFDHSVYGTKSLEVQCQSSNSATELPQWIWTAEGFAFQGFIPSCLDPTYCLTDPPMPPKGVSSEPFPPIGEWKFEDQLELTYTCDHPELRFPNDEFPPESWNQTLGVRCGWDQTWDPPVVPQCADPRQCEAPPNGNEVVFAQWDHIDEKDKRLSNDSKYWYQCQSGVFMLENEIEADFFELTCFNDGSGAKPYWIPVFLYNPFPKCVLKVPTSEDENVIVTLPTSNPALGPVEFPFTTRYHWPNFDLNATDPSPEDFEVVSGPNLFKEAVELKQGHDKCLIDKEFAFEGDTCIRNPVNCEDGFSFSLFFKPNYDLEPHQFFNASKTFFQQYIVSTGGDRGSPGFGIFIQGGDIGAVVSTGNLTWQVQVKGGAPDNKTWTNLAIKWKPALFNNQDELQDLLTVQKKKFHELGGLQLYRNLELIGQTFHPDEDVFGSDGEQFEEPEIMIGCHRTPQDDTARKFSHGTYDELAFWARALNSSEEAFFLGGYQDVFEDVGTDDLLKILNFIDYADVNQADTAINIMESIVNGEEEEEEEFRNIYPETTPTPSGTTEEDNGSTSTTLSSTTTTTAVPKKDPTKDVKNLMKIAKKLTGTGSLNYYITKREFDVRMKAVSPLGEFMGIKGKYAEGWTALKKDKNEAGPFETLTNLKNYVKYNIERYTVIPPESKLRETRRVVTSNNFAMEAFKMSSTNFGKLGTAHTNGYFKFPNWNTPEWTRAKASFGYTQSQDRPTESVDISSELFTEECKKKDINFVGMISDTFPDHGRKNPSSIFANHIELDSRVITLDITANQLDTEPESPTVNKFSERCEIDPKLAIKDPFIITFAIKSKRNHDFGRKLTSYYDSFDDKRVTNRHCVIWNEDIGPFGAWDTRGVTLVKADDAQATCYATKLGIYAIVAEIEDVPHAEDDETWLNIVKFIGYAVSIILLLIFIGVVLSSTYLWEMFHLIAVNMAFCLLFGHIFMLISEVNGIRDDRDSCSAIGLLILFFYSGLSVFITMECYAMFKAIISGIIGGHTRTYLCFGYGVPLFHMGLSIYLHLQEMGTDPRCMVGWANEVKEAFYIPVAIFGILSVCLITIIVCNINTPAMRKESMVEELGSLAKGLGVFVLLYGLTWSWFPFAYMRFPTHEFPDFYPAFQVMNAFMGMFFFVFIGLMSNRFRTALTGGILMRRKALLADASADDNYKEQVDDDTITTMDDLEHGDDDEEEDIEAAPRSRPVSGKSAKQELSEEVDPPEEEILSEPNEDDIPIIPPETEDE